MEGKGNNYRGFDFKSRDSTCWSGNA